MLVPSRSGDHALGLEIRHSVPGILAVMPLDAPGRTVRDFYILLPPIIRILTNFSQRATLTGPTSFTTLAERSG